MFNLFLKKKKKLKQNYNMVFAELTLFLSTSHSIPLIASLFSDMEILLHFVRTPEH